MHQYRDVEECFFSSGVVPLQQHLLLSPCPAISWQAWTKSREKEGTKNTCFPPHKKKIVDANSAKRTSSGSGMCSSCIGTCSMVCFFDLCLTVDTSLGGRTVPTLWNAIESSVLMFGFQGGRGGGAYVKNKPSVWCLYHHNLVLQIVSWQVSVCLVCCFCLIP